MVKIFGRLLAGLQSRFIIALRIYRFALDVCRVLRQIIEGMSLISGTANVKHG